jgi:sugar lactone lactonase YvrE
LRPSTFKRGAAALVGLLLAVTVLAPVEAAAPPKWTTTVFASVPSPGYPAYVFAHRNGRVYAGTYVQQGSRERSKVFEWTGDGTLTRSWTVPGQVLGGHGVQVANQTRKGKLVLLETSTASVMVLDITTGRFTRVARLPKGAVPNYATWVPGGSLLVTDYAAGVIWKVRRDGTVSKWFSSTSLQGVEFGTTGIVYRRGQRDLLISQQTTLGGATLPTNGALFSLSVTADGRPGRLSTLWTSLPAELPDGFGIGRSGHIYIAMAGLTAQLVELSATGQELDRFPDLPLTGDNGSPIPFDTPCSATFRGTKVLVANQSAIFGDASHQAILEVEVGERGRAPYLPKEARFRRS